MFFFLTDCSVFQCEFNNSDFMRRYRSNDYTINKDKQYISCFFVRIEKFL